MNKITLPFDDETLWSIIENDISTTTYTVDVKTSYNNLRDNLLYYISNLNLNVILDWTDCSTQIKKDVLKQYITMNRVFKNNDLNVATGNVLLVCKQLGYDPKGLLSYSDTVDFINDNLELVTRCVMFMDSVLVYMNYQLSNHNKSFNKADYEEVVTNNIPVNLVNLFSIIMFGIFYTDINPDNLRWYENQFKQPMFNNECLSAYVFSDDSFMAILGNQFNNVSPS